MAINQLQLPNPIQSPQLDWSRLDAIGDSIARYRQEHRSNEAISGAVDELSRPGQPASQPARASAPPQGGGAPGGQPHDFLDTIAVHNGINPQAFRRFAQLESGGDPNAQNGRYTGLFQLDPEDFTRRGGKNIADPRENASVAAQRLRENTEALRRRLGRDPTPTELYLSHQQGLGGVAAHMAAPDRPAWQAMLSTAEGRQRGEAWAKEAIWRNIPREFQQRFGSVDNVTSGDFVKLWQARVEGAPAEPPADPAQARSTGADNGPSLSPRDAARIKQLYAAGGDARRIALEMLSKQFQPKFGFQVLPDGTVLRTNQASGTVETVFTSGKPPFVMQEDEFGRKVYGRFDENGRIVPVQMPAGAQAPGQPAAGAPGAAPTAPVIPPSPPGADPKAWRKFWTEKAASRDAGKPQQEAQGAVVINDIDRTLEMMNAPGLPITGPIGALAQYMPGTNAFNASKLLQTIKANTAFDRLQQMRDASPTGGALGAVTAPELTLLINSIGNLEQSQNGQQFADNLRRVKNIYLDTIHGKGKGPPREPLQFEQRRAAPQQQPQQGQGRIQAGTVVNGFRFKGGNPNDQSSWERAQ